MCHHLWFDRRYQGQLLLMSCQDKGHHRVVIRTSSGLRLTNRHVSFQWALSKTSGHTGPHFFQWLVIIFSSHFHHINRTLIVQLGRQNPVLLPLFSAYHLTHTCRVLVIKEVSCPLILYRILHIHLLSGLSSSTGESSSGPSLFSHHEQASCISPG